MTPYRTTRRVRRRPPGAALLAAALLIAASLAAATACAEEGVVVARPLAYTTQLHAYAQVSPIAVLELRAATAGVVSGLDLLPGAAVQAGATLARLTGPAIGAALASRQATLASAEAALGAARKSLLAEQQNQRMHLATTQAVAQAEAGLAEAQARLDDATSQLATLKGEMTVQAPEAGEVLSLQAANGELVAPGQALLTVLPDHALWLKAAFYGAAAAALRPDMTGRFQPADGGAAIAVTLRSVLGVVRSGGGTEVGCAPVTPGAHWRNGEAGSLVLDGASGTLPAVPTRALVLDQGRWWVMLRTPRGDRPQAVTPGPAQGDETLIRQGLSPGALVVVENAYLDFHRDFAQHYQQPD